MQVSVLPLWPAVVSSAVVSVPRLWSGAGAGAGVCVTTVVMSCSTLTLRLDADADFDDPAENTSGFFDVMGLAMLTGRGWRALRGTIPDHRPIPESDVILAGVRDLEPYQRRRLDASEVCAVPGSIEPDPLRRHSRSCPPACRGSTSTWISTRSTAPRRGRTSTRRLGAEPGAPRPMCTPLMRALHSCRGCDHRP